MESFLGVCVAMFSVSWRRCSWPGKLSYNPTPVILVLSVLREYCSQEMGGGYRRGAILLSICRLPSAPSRRTES